jgi:lipid-binding SYLF domain-containing protein
MCLMDKQRRTALIAGVGLVGLASAGCTTTGSSATADPVARKKSIDAAADSALTRLYTSAGSRELVERARGILVFPNFVGAGFIVGGAAGDGVLRKGGKSVSYHRMTEASVGFLAGAQSQAVFILFMTDAALQRFEQSKGWTVGADASVAFLSMGADARVTSQTANQDVVGFVLTNAGLMANASLSGNRITPLGI